RQSPSCWAMTLPPCAAGSPATTSTALPGLKIDPAGADLGWAAHGSASGSVDCWPNPKRGRLVGSTSSLAVPRGAGAPCADVCVRSPAGGGLAWSPGATPTATRFWQPCGSRSPNCPTVRSCWPRRDPHQPAALGALNLDCPRHRQRVMPPAPTGGAASSALSTTHGPLPLPGRPQGRQRHL